MRDLNSVKLIIVLVGIFLLGCTRNNLGDDATQIRVFAAASLTEALIEVNQQFEQSQPGVEVIVNLAGSQQLAQQLLFGAPADVFASANEYQMDLVAASDRIEPGSQKIFAYNRLVVIFPVDNPGGIHDLVDLAKPGVRLIVATEQVPVGRYTLDFLEMASQAPEFGQTYKQAVFGNIVSFEESVKFVLTKVSIGEADAGIVYVSDFIGAGSKKIRKLDIPDRLNPVARYPIAPILDSRNSKYADKFIDFILSPQGQEIFERHGFIPVANIP